MVPLEKRLRSSLEAGDVELIKECCSEAFRLYSRLLFCVANNVLSNDDLARDAVSEVFVSFMSHLDTIELSSIKYYLVQSVNRIAIRMLYEASKAEEFEENKARSATEPCGIALDASSALSVLDETERKIVVYKIEYGYKFAEIGKMLGMSENAASSKYSRSIKKMRKALEGGR